MRLYYDEWIKIAAYYKLLKKKYFTIIYLLYSGSEIFMNYTAYSRHCLSYSQHFMVRTSQNSNTIFAEHSKLIPF